MFICIIDLTVLSFGLISALDSGKYANISVEEVELNITDGTIFKLLSHRLQRDIDLSMLDDKKKAELLDEWQRILNAYGSRHTFGIENNGLALLLSYCIQGIQSRRPNDDKSS